MIPAMIDASSPRRRSSNASAPVVSNLHRSLLTMIIDNGQQLEGFLSYQLERSCTAIVPYQQCQKEQKQQQNQKQSGTLFCQFMAIVAAAALLESYHDPDPPEIREMEREEKMEQLEIENDALYMSLEDTEWELDLLKKKYRQLKTRYHIVSSDAKIQAEYVLELSKKYSDTRMQLAETEANRDDMQIAYKGQLAHQEQLICDLEAERDDALNQVRTLKKDISQLESKYDSYEVALAAKDLKILQLASDYEDLKQKDKQQRQQKQQKQKQQQRQDDEQLSDNSVHIISPAATRAMAMKTLDPLRPKNLKVSLDQYMITEAAAGNRWINGLNRLNRIRRTTTSTKEKSLDDSSTVVTFDADEEEEVEVENETESAMAE